jgi:ketosteroid isomerase-like protein
VGSPIDETLRIAQAAIAALTHRDADALFALLDDDCVLEAAYPIRAGENVTGARRCQGQPVRDFVTDVTRLVARIDFENVVWRTTSDGLALFEADGDLEYPNGDPYRNHYLMFFEVKDGRIVRWREYYSPVVWARAVGVPLESLP